MSQLHATTRLRHRLRIRDHPEPLAPHRRRRASHWLRCTGPCADRWQSCSSPFTAGVGSPANAEASARTSGGGGERYVALGDSAAAGPIILPQQGGPLLCFRSARNFPTLAAAGLGVGSFKDVTCSSAVIDNLWSARHDAPPQLAALARSTTLVTLGPIGANDADLFDVALRCLVPGCARRDGRTVHRAVEASRPKLKAALRAIRRRAPRAVRRSRPTVVRGRCPAPSRRSGPPPPDGARDGGLLRHGAGRCREGQGEAAAPSRCCGAAACDVCSQRTTDRAGPASGRVGRARCLPSRFPSRETRRDSTLRGRAVAQARDPDAGHGDGGPPAEAPRCGPAGSAREQTSCLSWPVIRRRGPGARTRRCRRRRPARLGGRPS